jgi:hypothetical protein
MSDMVGIVGRVLGDRIVEISLDGFLRPAPSTSVADDSVGKLIRGYTESQWDSLTEMADQLPGELYGRDDAEFEETIIALADLVNLVRQSRLNKKAER